MKKVGKYITITLLMLVGLFFVGLLFLFFIPNSSLFGITFISYNERTFSEFYNLDTNAEINTVNSVKINSRAYDVKVKSSNSENLYLQVENHSLGYVLKDNKNLIIKESLNNKVLTFTITEPYGVAFKNNSSITLYVPTDKEINLTLSNKTAAVEIDNTHCKINNFSYSTERGTLNLKNASISGELNLNLNKANAKISSNVNLNNNNLNLKITTGKFDASNSVLGDVNILENQRGVIILNECRKLSQPKQTSGGRVEANKVSNVDFYGTDTNLYLTEITNGAKIEVTTGTVNINSLSGDSDIKSTTGSISINEMKSTLTVFATTGNINVSKAFNQIFATTDSGCVTINFDESSDYATSGSVNYRFLKVISKSGNVNATGLNSADFKITGTGNVNVNFASFQDDLKLISDIQTEKGNIFVSVNYSDKYILNSKTNGNSRINLMQTEKYNGWTDKLIQNKSINGASGVNANQINLKSSSGNILMHDNKVN